MRSGPGMVGIGMGPFIGMRYSWRAPIDPHLAYRIDNMLPAVRGLPSELVGVYQPQRLATFGAALNVQHVTNFTPGVVTFNVLIAGGELYDDRGGGFVKNVTAAQLAAAGIVLAAAGRVYSCQFAGGLVVNDGAHTMFSWDGTIGGGLTKLTNAPIAFGRPTVYYGKLFVIENANRDVIDWSEENAPNTGYVAGGFNNTWRLTQSGQGPLYCLVGTNDALYYFRADRAGAIRGAANTDFQAAGVHDDIADIGTTDPEGAQEIGDSVWLTDIQARPWAFRPGEKPEPVWEQVADLFTAGTGDFHPPYLGIAPGASAPVPVDSMRAVAIRWGSDVGAAQFVLFDSVTRQALSFWSPPGGIPVFGVAGDGTYGELVVGGVRGIGLAYGQFVSGAVGVVDFWPPVASGDYHAYAPGTGAQYRPMVITPALELGTRSLTRWVEAAVTFYMPRGIADGGQQVAAFVNQRQRVTAATFGQVPTDFDQVGGAGATVAVPSFAAERASVRKTWGLKRRSRTLQVAVQGAPGAPFGVERIILSGKPEPLPPGVT